MIVYIVECGERHEGGSTVGVYSSMESAQNAAMRVDCHFDGGWEAQDENVWHNGCDYVRIVAFPVSP